MTFGQMGRIPQTKNYKNHSMIKNLKLLVIFRRVSVVCLLGKFLLPQVETKIIEWFLYVWKNTQTEKNYVILIQKPNHSESHKYTVEKFVWCFLKKEGNVVSKLFTRNKRLVKQKEKHFNTNTPLTFHILEKRNTLSLPISNLSYKAKTYIVSKF